MDSDEETLLLVLLLKRKRILDKNKKKKAKKTLPLFCITQQTEFYKVKNYSDKQFQSYLRLSRKQFYELLPRLESYIGKQNTTFKNTICAEERLFITLRFLAEGCSLTNLYHTYNRGLSTICAIVKEVCRAIYEILHTIYIPELREEDWLIIANGYYTKANFPNCLGAIDGKHIRIIKPEHTGSLYYNYKNYFSIVLLAICDSNYCYTYIDVGSYGKASDSQIFKNSRFYKRLQEQTLNIPNPLPITNNGPPVPFVFIGDEAFGISNFIQRPYAGNYLNEKKRIFNYRLSRARRYIECSFGIMANQWRILHRPINVQLPFAEDIVRACCVLHNLLRKTYSKSSNSNPTILRYDLQNLQQNQNNHLQISAAAIRDTLADYFVSSEGELSWQTMKI